MIEIEFSEDGDPDTIEDVEGLEAVLSDVVEEILDAADRYGKFTSPHEGLAIIQEEFEEFKNAVFWPHKGHGDANKEAVQLAAMALRYLIDITYRYNIKRK